MVVEFDWDKVGLFLAGVALLVLSAWILLLGPERRINRSLALVCFIEAFVLGIRPFEGPFTEPVGRFREYFIIAIPFAALNFAHAFLVHGSVRKAFPMHRWIIPSTILLVGVACETAYFLNHDLAGNYDYVTAQNQWGPFQAFAELYFASFAAVGLLFAYAFRQAKDGNRRRVFYLGAAAFTLMPIYIQVFLHVQWLWQLGFDREPLLAYYSVPFNQVSEAISLVAIALLVWAGLLLARVGKGAADQGEYARAYRRLAIGAIISGTIAAAFFIAKPIRHWDSPHWVLYGLWALTLPAFLVAPVLQHRILDIELKVRVSIQRTTVVTALLAVAFVVAETAANYLSDFTSLTTGGIAAGLLLFAIHPMMRFAERFAHKAIPNARSVAHMRRREREDFYAEQARIAWMDGKLERKERMLLDQLRVRLGINASEAAKLESKVVTAA